MNDSTNQIPFSLLEDRGIYKIRSRNLLVGVYRARSRDFTGIRQNFWDRYLFSEMLNDPPGRGTVTEVMGKLGVVPEEIELSGQSRGLFALLNGLDRNLAPGLQVA